MKKIAILSVALLVAGFAHAQSPKFGIKAGVNIAKFAGDPDPNSEFNTGLAAGVFTNVPLSSGFSFEPSLEYSQKGAEFTTALNSEVKSKITYLDLPIMFKYNLTPNFGILAGPQVSFFLDQETKLVNGNSTTTFEGNNDSYRKSLAGGKVGLSYNFGSVMLNASYATDLQNLYSDDSGNSDLKNQVINVGLAFGFK
ncbi:porin family protein [Daejeonella lutea]|uniref:Outer membrane protein beta-barrel domain-containing protein n=1 Tax=Daejeonella lutea TaxID=572036 RepID=A0A1T5D9W7_9SPHI|nr:porin family protein [Daejeonella lutea]SKB68401.1 Outer membrane protein beta-barrel domain-containing protein [Daejeonella lutea]